MCCVLGFFEDTDVPELGMPAVLAWSLNEWSYLVDNSGMWLDDEVHARCREHPACRDSNACNRIGASFFLAEFGIAHDHGCIFT